MEAGREQVVDAGLMRPYVAAFVERVTARNRLPLMQSTLGRGDRWAGEMSRRSHGTSTLPSRRRSAPGSLPAPQRLRRVIVCACPSWESSDQQL